MKGFGITDESSLDPLQGKFDEMLRDGVATDHRSCWLYLASKLC